MRTLEPRLEKHINLLISRYPALGEVKQAIIDAYLVMEECYEHDGKLLIAGNGGSAADSEHIAGELMKRFKTPRPVTPAFAEKLKEIDPVRGENLAKNLERGLMAIPLVAHEALSTAYINDVDGLGVFAQQLFGFGRPGDVFLGISTSGNSKNVYLALGLAKRKGCFTAAFLGKDGGTIKEICDLPLVVKSNNTPHIQACHIFMGHCMCELVDQAY